MKTKLRTDVSIRELCEGFIYSEAEGKGLFGWSGRLTIQPEYQRNYMYAEQRKDVEVIHSVLNSYPIGLMYFNQTAPDKYEVLDGQQRITSIGRFVTDKFAIKDAKGMEIYFSGLDESARKKFLDYKVLIYVCEGDETEIKEWFQIVNVAGEPLKPQELLNAVYSGSFVSLAKAVYSNSRNPLQQKWRHYISGDPNRQEILYAALKWVARGKDKISGYMSQHRRDTNINDLTLYFDSVIDWAKAIFGEPRKEMRTVEWGELYEKYHTIPYNPTAVRERVSELFQDRYIDKHRKKAIFEYVLGGEQKPSLLNVRVFDDDVKDRVYEKQTAEAKEKGISNCPLCAISNTSNRTRIWLRKEMEADHVTAWSKGGATDESNCQMLCSTHNKAKGNS